MKTLRWLMFVCLFGFMLFVLSAYNKQVSKRIKLEESYANKYDVRQDVRNYSVLEDLTWKELSTLKELNYNIYRIEMLLAFVSFTNFVLIIFYVSSNYQRFVDWYRKVKGVKPKDPIILKSKK